MKLIQRDLSGTVGWFLGGIMGLVCLWLGTLYLDLKESYDNLSRTSSSPDKQSLGDELILKSEQQRNKLIRELQSLLPPQRIIANTVDDVARFVFSGELEKAEVAFQDLVQKEPYKSIHSQLGWGSPYFEEKLLRFEESIKVAGYTSLVVFKESLQIIPDGPGLQARQYQLQDRWYTLNNALEAAYKDLVAGKASPERFDHFERIKIAALHRLMIVAMEPSWGRVKK